MLHQEMTRHLFVSLPSRKQSCDNTLSFPCLAALQEGRAKTALTKEMLEEFVRIFLQKEQRD